MRDAQRKLFFLYHIGKNGAVFFARESKFDLGPASIPSTGKIFFNCFQQGGKPFSGVVEIRYGFIKRLSGKIRKFFLKLSERSAGAFEYLAVRNGIA